MAELTLAETKELLEKILGEVPYSQFYKLLILNQMAYDEIYRKHNKYSKYFTHQSINCRYIIKDVAVIDLSLFKYQDKEIYFYTAGIDKEQDENYVESRIIRNTDEYLEQLYECIKISSQLIYHYCYKSITKIDIDSSFIKLNKLSSIINNKSMH